MQKGLDIAMYFFVFLVVIAALKNPSGFAKDITAIGGSATGFGNSILSQVPSS